MSVTATITADCRYLSLVLSGQSGIATLTVRNGSNSHTFNATLPGGNGTFNTVLNTHSQLGTGDGIFEVTMLDTSGIPQYAAVLGDCALNCCITKKISHIIGCDCGCIKCNHHLQTAERVNLLILAIKTSLAQISDSLESNTAILTDAKAKYAKALELCSDSCGCNC